MIRQIRTFLRGATALVLFAVFGLGALLISPFMILLRKPERCQPLIRKAWQLMTALFVITRLIRIDRGNLKAVHGSVIAANHPSLIDVVLLTSLLPRTLYVAKHGLRTNPFLSVIVRATALPDDAQLMERAACYLAQGWNVLIFPEGTRSPAGGGLQPLHRGAAQLALRTGAPLVGVRIDIARRTLGKGQPPWDVGDRPIDCGFTMFDVDCVRSVDESLRSAAVRITDCLFRSLWNAR